MAIFARWVMYGLLGVVCLLVAGLAFTLFGSIGALLGSGCFGMLQSLGVLRGSAAEQAQWQSWFAIAGMMLGGGSGLAGLALIWLAEAQQSSDPIIRRCANELDTLRRVVWRC